MKLGWNPRPDLRGQVWEVFHVKHHCMVRRMEPDGENVFAAMINELIVGTAKTPLDAIAITEGVLRNRLGGGKL